MNEKLRQMRIDLNISQKELAKAVNVQQSTISRIERNCSTTSYKLIIKIFLFLRYKHFENPEIGVLKFDENIFEFITILLNDDLILNLIEKDSAKLSNQFIDLVKKNI